MGNPPRALAIAASDSSGAAGMQADLKTFEARGIYGMSALTAITAQDSSRIYSITHLDAAFVAGQIRAVLGDFGADAVKTGLLFRAEIIEAVAESLPTEQPNLVVDPVLVAGDGRPLVNQAGIAAYLTHLFPRAALITPNLDEVRILTGYDIETPEDMIEAAQALSATGANAVLVKGGHLARSEMVDILWDGESVHEFRSERLPIENPRGTGCTYAACITAELARGSDLVSAVGIAKGYLSAALREAIGWQLGAGRGTVYHGVGRPLFAPPSA